MISRIAQTVPHLPWRLRRAAAGVISGRQHVVVPMPVPTQERRSLAA